MKSGKIADNSAALGGEGIYVRGGSCRGGTVEGDALAEDSDVTVTVTSAEPLPDTNPDAALTGGEIAGIAVGSVVGAALTGTGIFFLIRKRRKV